MNRRTEQKCKIDRISVELGNRFNQLCLCPSTKSTIFQDLKLKMPEKEKSNFQHPIVPVASTDYIEPFELEHPDTWMQLMVYPTNPSDHGADCCNGLYRMPLTL